MSDENKYETSTQSHKKIQDLYTTTKFVFNSIFLGNVFVKMLSKVKNIQHLENALKIGKKE